VRRDMSTLHAPSIPANHLDTERAVLGSVLRGEVADALDRVVARLTEHDFFTDYHRAIFAALRALHEAGQPADVHTLGPLLEGVPELAPQGGLAYLEQLFHEAAIPAHLDSYIARVLKDAGARLSQAAIEVALEQARAGAPIDSVAAELTESLGRIAERAEPDAGEKRRACG